MAKLSTNHNLTKNLLHSKIYYISTAIFVESYSVLDLALLYWSLMIINPIKTGNYLQSFTLKAKLLILPF